MKNHHFAMFMCLFLFIPCFFSPSVSAAQNENILWSEDWEDPSWTDDWHADQGTWDAGVPTSGPDSSYAGQNCAATILDDNYSENVRSRFIRHTYFTVPPAEENPHLRFWHWVSCSTADYGKVQIRVSGNTEWEDIPNGKYAGFMGGVWTHAYLDLSAYADSLVQIAFYFYSSTTKDSFRTYTNVSSGWYIDNVTVITGDDIFQNPEDWESGINDWYVDYGTWEVGVPTSGPESAYEGQSCAATVLGGNYVEYVGSRIISPIFIVPSAEENPRLRFRHWFSFSTADYGKVQIRIHDSEVWEDIPEGYYTGVQDGGWTYPYLDLSAYADSLLQIAFYFYSYTTKDSFRTYTHVSSGWYIDDVTVEPVTISTEKYLKITSPNGGELLLPGTDLDIKWVYNNIETITLEYSTDNGNTWSAIASDIDVSTKSYIWSVPDVESTECLIRISDTTNSSLTDRSNGVFTIERSAITVTSPNGGENWSGRTTYDITWTSTFVNNVKIEYSATGGSNWTTIVSSTNASSGSYSWDVSNYIDSYNCLIRISESSNADNNDISDSSFSISSTPITNVFSPALLTLSAPETIQYKFDSSNLEIPVTVSGTTAGVIFCVFTKDKANQIPKTINGYLGWHHVNKVDTCIYYSTLQSFHTGNHIITWDGKDQDGGVVPSNDYTYYLWAFDNQGAKQKMCEFLDPGWAWDMVSDVREVDENGLPLTNPIWFTPTTRWYIGGDPYDQSLMEETFVEWPEGWSWNYRSGDPCLHPSNFDYFYVNMRNDDGSLARISKYHWVPFGDAIPATDFGTGGHSEEYSIAGGGSPGVCTDGNYLYTADENHTGNPDEPDADFYIYDFNGNKVNEIDLSPWWSSYENAAAGGQMNGGPNNFTERHGMVFLNCHGSCLKQMVDPLRYLESGNAEDFYVWTNRNGDYVLDHNFEETAALPWVCNDYNVGPYIYSVSSDDNLFTQCCAYNPDAAVSFGLLAPDGTGLGYFAFAGDTAGWNRGSLFIDSGTPFDGIYCDNTQTGGPDYEWDAEKAEQGIFFIGHDSIKGTITNIIGPHVTVDSPNGGELLPPGTDLEIKWLSNNVETVTLEYSIDNGNTWSAIATGIDASTKSYTWSVPDVESTSCLIKISDASDATVFDVSDAKFSIDPPHIMAFFDPVPAESGKQITVPVNIDMSDGSLLLGEYSATLTWPSSLLKFVEATGGTTDGWGDPLLNLENTEQGELKCSAIYADGSPGKVNILNLTFDVVGGDGENGTLQLELSSLSAAKSFTDLLPFTEITDFTYTISALPSITVTSPNGEEVLKVESTATITWSSTHIENVKIEYTADGGSTWVVISESTDAASGKYEWSVPGGESSDCKIRVSSTEDPEITDESDEPFTVSPTGIWGDVNDNEKVNSADGLIIASYGIDIPVGEYENNVLSRGDVNADDELGLADGLICARYGIQPDYAELPVRVGQPLGTVAKAVVHPVVTMNETAVPCINMISKSEHEVIVATSVGTRSADLPIGAASILIRWDHSAYHFEGIEKDNRSVVINRDAVESGEIRIAIIDINGTATLSFPKLKLRPIHGKEPDPVVVEVLEAVHAESFAQLKVTHEQIASEGNNETGHPVLFGLEQNVPNPFNPSTIINYTITEPAFVNLNIYNIQGQKVKTLIDRAETAGFHSITWNGTDDRGMGVSSGVYIYQLVTHERKVQKQMLLVR